MSRNTLWGFAEIKNEVSSHLGDFLGDLVAAAEHRLAFRFAADAIGPDGKSRNIAAPLWEECQSIRQGLAGNLVGSINRTLRRFRGLGGFIHPCGTPHAS